jgi:uncharacterized protein (DUF2267 family)
MSHTTIDAVEHSVETTNIWLKELAGELGRDDRREAYRVLRSVLHALRDRIGVNESAQLAAQLPGLVRGVFYEGWDPSRTPERYRDADAFLDRVAGEARLSGETQASYAVTAVMAVLRRHVSEGELADVLAVLPPQVRALMTG